MRPIPAPRIGDSHGLLRAVDARERVRLDEFVTEFSVEELYPAGLENALGRTRQFVSYARAAGLLTEDRGTVELTDIGRRYVRAGDPVRPFDVSPGQAEWLRRLLREKHMTDSIFHGLAIGLSLLASSPGARVSTLDFGRALAYLGRAGWDNENTLEIQGERHVTLLVDLDLIDGDRRLTAAGDQVKGELTLPVHMSLEDLAAQLNPQGPDAARDAGAAEWGGGGNGAATAPEDDEYEDVRGTAPLPPEPRPEPAREPEEAASDPADAATVISLARGPDPPDPAAAPGPERSEPLPAPPRVIPSGFVDVGAAAAERGLRMDAGVYANAAAALAAGRHVLLLGPPGSGKTALALAVAKAGVDAGRADGAMLVAGADPSLQGHAVAAARRARWLVIDDLDAAAAEQLAPLSPLLAHLPATLPHDGGELAAPDTWRVVATARSVPDGLPASRFACIAVPPHENLRAAVEDAAGGDRVAVAAVTRLLALADRAPLGAGPFLAAARHAAARHAAAPADERTLAREVHAAYLAPLLPADEDGRDLLR